jgi:hypothetical protein
MNTLPLWFTAGWAVVAVLGVLGGAAFALFVMLPYMRRTEAMMRAGRADGEELAATAADIRAAMTELRALTKDIDRERVNRLFSALEEIPEKLEGLKKASVRDALGKL